MRTPHRPGRARRSRRLHTLERSGRLRSSARRTACAAVAALASAAVAVLGLPAQTASAQPPATATATATGTATAGAATTAAASPGGSPAYAPVCDAPKPGEFSCFALRRTGGAAAKGVRPAVAAPDGFGPADLRSAYDLPDDGGAGRTVAIVDAYDDPSAEADLAVYREQYGLPACTTADGCFAKVDQRGGTDYPAPDAGWAGEISLDLDMVSAVAPNAHILLVEGDDSGDTALGAAVDEAVALGAGYVSNSYGTDYRSGQGEDPSETTTLDAYYDHPGVAVVASSGDYSYGVAYPAASQYVTSVGGTSLARDPDSARGWSESAWSGAGSGCSLYEPKPSFQQDGGCANRSVADVSAVADPATGVAVYQTYGGAGWSSFGGTSVSSPIIAGVYADAAAPAAGTYPNSYPYTAGTGLHDVTSGSNGSCDVGYECQAQAGYDGPTGLGTPDGLQAFRAGPHGELTGTVTDRASGKPVAGATVSDGTDVARTDAKGRYSLVLPAGSQDITVTAFGYAEGTAKGLEVAENATLTRDFALAQVPSETVSGKVADGSGHRWPLYAKITVDGDPNAAWSDPRTGAYRLTLPRDADFTLRFAAASPGYDEVAKDVHVARSAVSADIAMTADPWLATAPGYAVHLTGDTETFDATDAAPQGWSVVNAGDTEGGWEFDDPGGRGNDTGGDGGFAIADSNHAGIGKSQDSSLVSPVYDFSGKSTPEVAFNTMYLLNSYRQTLSVEATDDGGATWTNVWSPVDTPATGYVASQRFDVPLTAFAGRPNVQLRFHYVANQGWYWGVDDVFVGQRDYPPTPGGMVVGTVADANTGQGAVDATVTDRGDPSVTARTVRTPDDPQVGDGFFSLFTPGAGKHALTATKPSYSARSQTVRVRADATVSASYRLDAGRLVVSPGTLDASVGPRGHATRTLTVRNTGSAPATLQIGELAAGPQPAAARSTPLRRIPGDYPMGAVRPSHAKTAGPAAGAGAALGAGAGAPKPSADPAAHPAAGPAAGPAADPAADPWQSAPALPDAVMDNVADGYGGKVYSAFGDAGLSIGGDTSSKDLYALDPAAGTWTRLAAAHDARQAPGHGIIDGKLYAAGGWGSDGNPDPSLEVYDIATGTWTTGASEPRPHAGVGSAVLDGKLYLIGGCDVACGVTDASVYDPATDGWSQIAPYPEAVAWTSCAGIGGKLYCAGGATSDGGDVRHAYVYDPASAAWSALPDMPTPLWGSAYAAANGLLVVSGGVSGNAVTNQGFAYDPRAGAWSALPNATTPTYRGGGAVGFYKVGGSAGGVTPSTVVEALPGYGVDPGVDVPWLHESTQRVTLPPGGHASIRVTLDARVPQIASPGQYGARLVFGSTTPYALPPVDVTLHVAAT